MIHPTARVHASSIVSPEADVGQGAVVGPFCHIHEGVTIGQDTQICSYVELRSGTVVGRQCYIDSYVVSSGNCQIEDHVTLRYGTIIARGCHIGRGAYLSPRVMTNNVDHNGREVGGAEIGANCFIGTHAVLAAGIRIRPETVIGSCALVTRTIDEPGIYIGMPAKKK